MWLNNRARTSYIQWQCQQKKSEQYGLKVYLCPRHHNISSEGAHENPVLALSLKKFAQRKFEEKWGHEKFMEVFHKNYL